jgi:hypothetical protein
MFCCFHFLNYYRTFHTCIVGNLTERFFYRFLNQFNTGHFVAFSLHIIDRNDGIDQSSSATGHNTFFNRRLGCSQSVFNAMFLFFQFSLGCSTNLDYSYAA